MVKKTHCLFCAWGCGIAFRTQGEEILGLDYDRDNPLNQGALCPRGYYNLELLNHPRRLGTPRIGARRVTWAEATEFTRQELKQFAPENLGILISSSASNEEAWAAARYAQQLGTKNIAASGSLADLAAYRGSNQLVTGAELATPTDLEQAEVLVIVGDLLTRTPVLARRVNRVKYGKRGNRIIVIDPNRTHTSWFATDHLAVRPGSEAAALAALTGKVADGGSLAAKTGIAAEKLANLAQVFAQAASGVVMVVPSDRRANCDLEVYFAKVLAAASPQKKYLVLYNYPNAAGVNALLDREIPGHTGFAEIIKKIEEQSLKALIMLGENICTEQNDLNKKCRWLKFTAVSGYFGKESAVTSDNVVTFPLASHLEKTGHYLLAAGQTATLTPVVKAVGTKSEAEIIALLAGIAPEEVTKIERPEQAVDFDNQVQAALAAEIKASVPLENITHFGNNRLVKNFFWYRVNNRG